MRDQWSARRKAFLCAYTGVELSETNGNTRYAKCLDCGERIEIVDIRKAFEEKGEPPDCSSGDILS